MAVSADCERIAADLFRALAQRTTTRMPVNALAGFSKAEAVKVSERVRELRIAAGETPAGYKVGFTNPAVRAQFGADGLLAAPVYRETVSYERRVRAAAFLGPRIEPEVVVGIGADGVAWAAFGFEIVQSHAKDWDFSWLDAIADFGLHAALVIGERRTLAPGDGERLGRIRVNLLCDGAVVERGGGSDIDGGPLGSVAWLRGELARAGRTLHEGDIVSTGSLTRVPPIAPGQRWTIACDHEQLESLSIEVV